jgi:hypothetical protein
MLSFSPPLWLVSLRSHPALRPLRWLSPSEAQARLNVLRDPKGPLFSEGLRPDVEAVVRARLACFWPVAEGPPVPYRGRWVGVGNERAPLRPPSTTPLWLINTDAPDRLWLALSDTLSPLLWVDAGATAERARGTLDEHLVPQAAPEEELPGRLRLFAGRDDGAGLGHFERHFAADAFCDGLSWGTWSERDPYLDPCFAESMARPEGALSYLLGRQQSMAQLPGQLPVVSVRTRLSKSVLRAEAHGDHLVVEVRYRPTRAGAPALRRWNEVVGADYPDDLPLDVVAALAPFGPASAAQVLAELLTEPGELTPHPTHVTFPLYVLGTLGGPPLARAISEAIVHPDPRVRRLVVAVARWHGQPVEPQRAGTERDPFLRQRIGGGPAPEPLFDRPQPGPLTVVLAPDVTREEVKAVARERRWLWLAASGDAESDRRYELSFSDESNTHFVCYREDPVLGLALLQLDGPDPATFAESLRAALPLLGPRALLGRFSEASTYAETAFAIAALGASSPREPSPEWRQAFGRALAHPEPELRKIALMALSGAAWPGALELIERVAEEDDDVEVGALACELLDAAGDASRPSLPNELGRNLRPRRNAARGPPSPRDAARGPRPPLQTALATRRDATRRDATPSGAAAPPTLSRPRPAPAPARADRHRSAGAPIRPWQCRRRRLPDTSY